MPYNEKTYSYMEGSDPSSKSTALAKLAHSHASPREIPSSCVLDAGHTGAKPSMTTVHTSSMLTCLSDGERWSTSVSVICALRDWDNEGRVVVTYRACVQADAVHS